MSTDLSMPTLTAKEAARQLGVSRALIELWAKENGPGCPFLGGKQLIAFRNPHSRKGVRYDAAQVGAIKAAREQALRHEGRESGFMPYHEAKRRFGFSQSALYGWQDKGCCYLNGDKLDGHRETRPVAEENGLREIWVYDRGQLEHIAELRDREREGIFEDEQGTWLSAVAAHEIYKIWDASLGDWRKKSCAFLGRKIKYKPMRRLLRSGRYRTRIVYLESDLETIAAAQCAPPTPATYQDGEGTWLFAVEVARRTGWPADGLWYYREKEWPCLPGGNLRAKKVSAEHHPDPRISLTEVWVYYEAHIECIMGRVPADPLAALGLNETERHIVAWVREHGPQQGKNIAAGIGFRFNSYFRGILSKLRKHGVLLYSLDGYEAE
jgi:hypothetical protein